MNDHTAMQVETDARNAIEHGVRCHRDRTMRELTAARAEQASTILDALDEAARPGQACIDAIGRDCNGVAFVRAGGATWRGLSVRDALAQFLQSR